MIRTLAALLVLVSAALAPAFAEAGLAPAGRQEPKTTDTRSFKIVFRKFDHAERATKKFLWVTNDGRATWKTPEEAGVKYQWLEPTGDGNLRCSVTVPSDGVWGFSGQFGDKVSNTAEAPKPGEKPENYIELRIDTSKGAGGISWLAPSKSETWEGGKGVQLRWTTIRREWKEPTGRLYYSIDGREWILITKGVEPADFYFWSVPSTATTNLRLKIEATAQGGAEVEAVSPQMTVTVAERPDIAQARKLADRARILQAQSNFAAASLEFEKALAAWPDYPEALNDLGAVYAGQKQYAKALEFFLRARKASPSDPRPYVNGASMEFRLGLAEDALRELKDAVELEKIDQDARLALQAGELLWKIAVRHALSEETEQTREACELILRIRGADRNIRQKAADYLGRKK